MRFSFSWPNRPACCGSSPHEHLTWALYRPHTNTKFLAHFCAGQHALQTSCPHYGFAHPIRSACMLTPRTYQSPPPPQALQLARHTPAATALLSPATMDSTDRRWPSIHAAARSLSDAAAPIVVRAGSAAGWPSDHGYVMCGGSAGLRRSFEPGCHSRFCALRPTSPASSHASVHLKSAESIHPSSWRA